MSLQQTPPRRARRLAGRVALATIVCVSGYAALAAHAADTISPTRYAVKLTIATDEDLATPVLHTRAEETFRVSGGSGKHKWNAEFVLHRIGDKVQIDSTFKHDGAIMTKPRLLGRLGEPMGMGLGASGDAPSLKMMVIVTELPPT